MKAIRLIKQFLEKLGKVISCYCLNTFCHVVHYNIRQDRRCQQAKPPVISSTSLLISFNYTPSAEVLSRVKWPSLENIYTTRTLVLAHSVFYFNAPSEVQNIFAKYHCKYDLRRGNCFALPKPKTNFLLKSVHYSAAKRWNALPNHLRAIETLGPFKKGLRSLEDNDQKLSIS